jgi:hypothetical protein
MHDKSPNRAKPHDCIGRGILFQRASSSLTRHIVRFDIPLQASTESDPRNPDKEQLRADILAMVQRGMSYLKIGMALGIHWTRVGQIVKNNA